MNSTIRISNGHHSSHSRPDFVLRHLEVYISRLGLKYLQGLSHITLGCAIIDKLFQSHFAVLVNVHCLKDSADMSLRALSAHSSRTTHELLDGVCDLERRIQI